MRLAVSLVYWAARDRSRIWKVFSWRKGGAGYTDDYTCFSFIILHLYFSILSLSRAVFIAPPYLECPWGDLDRTTPSRVHGAYPTWSGPGGIARLVVFPQGEGGKVLGTLDFIGKIVKYYSVEFLKFQ